jgi:hypothetical protein
VPRLTGDADFDRGAQDDLAGVLARIITGYTGTGGVADLDVTIGDSDTYDSSRFVARKFWRDAAGGPRIELLEIKKFGQHKLAKNANAAAKARHKAARAAFKAEQAADGWRSDYEKLRLSASVYVRVRQTLAGSRSNSKMMADWVLGRALAEDEEEGYGFGGSKPVKLELRVFDMPETIATIQPISYGGEGFSPWQKGYQTDVEAAETTADVGKMQLLVNAGRLYLERKKGVLALLARTWHEVEVPISSERDTTAERKEREGKDKAAAEAAAEAAAAGGDDDDDDDN